MPAKAIESLRVEAARSLVEESRHAIDVVARETGFADSERMRRAFIRKFGHPPQTFRRVANKAAVAPAFIDASTTSSIGKPDRESEKLEISWRRDSISDELTGSRALRP